jgi:hypothetical protein
MFFQEGEEVTTVRTAATGMTALLLSTAAIFLIGLFPAVILGWMDRLF